MKTNEIKNIMEGCKGSPFKKLAYYSPTLTILKTNAKTPLWHHSSCLQI